MDDEELTARFESFVRTFAPASRESYYKQFLRAVREGQRSLVVDFADLDKFDLECADRFLKSPKKTVKLFELAMKNIDPSVNQKLHVRFFNLPEFARVRLKDLRSKHLKVLVVVDGLIRHATEVRPEATEIVFECLNCSNRERVPQVGFVLSTPSRCTKCGRRFFREISRKFIDVQNVKLEESPEQLEGGEQPSRIDVVVRDDLVEPDFRQKLTPGNQIRVIGVLEERVATGNSQIKSNRFDIYVDANYIETTVQEFEKLEISEEEAKKLKELAADPKIREKLIASVAPTIYGFERIKEAIALQLFGGQAKTHKDKIRTRGDIHILLIGDPGSGKSQLLKYVSKLAPKAMYVSGQGASSAGLTAAVVRDEMLKTWALEAGAMVLANKGIAMVDEVDKMKPEDRVAMHEVMEQQQVTVAKANIHATLLARTAILAAANPKYNRFDTTEPIHDQINMPDTLLSRFDLIFAIKDIPQKERDELLVSHILDLHKAPQGGLDAPISSDVLRKYISFARKTFNPRLTDEALKTIKQFYLSLRAVNWQDRPGAAATNSVAITPRQLEALVRLAEASARLRFSDRVNAEDAKHAVELMTYCLYELGSEKGRIDIDKYMGGIPTSRRNVITSVLDIIKELEQSGKVVQLQHIYDKALEKNLSMQDVEKVIDELRRRGDIFEPKPGEIRRF